MNRLPIRVRLTLGFAAAMAVVLAGVGAFVYQRVGNELLATVDQTLVAQSTEALSYARVDVDAGGGATLAQVFGRSGALRSSDPRGLPRLVSRDVLAAAPPGRKVWLERRVPGRPGGGGLPDVPPPPGSGARRGAPSVHPRAGCPEHRAHAHVVI